MAKGFNIRAWLGLDTKDYEKGISRAKRQTRQFSKGMKQSIQGATGAATGALDRMTGGAISGFKGIFQGVKMATKGMKGFKIALMSTGIGALVIALGSLITYFKSSAEGQEKFNKLLGGLKGIIGFIQLGLESFGKILVSIWEDPQKYIKEFGNVLKDQVFNRIKAVGDYIVAFKDIATNVFSFVGAKIKGFFTSDQGVKDAMKKQAEEAAEGVKQGLQNAGQAGIQVVTGMDKEQQRKAVEGAKNFGKDVGNAWTDGVDLAADENALVRAARKEKELQASLTRDIAELRRKIRDEDNYTMDQQLDFIAKAKKANKDLYASKIRLVQEELRLHEENMGMSSTDIDDLNKKSDLQQQITQLQAAQANGERTLLRDQLRVNNELEREVEQRQKSFETIQSINAELQRMSDEPELLDEDLDFVTPLQEYEMQLKKLREEQSKSMTSGQFQELQAQIDSTQEKMNEFKGVSETMAGAMTESMGGAAQSIASAFGLAEKSFASFALSLLENIPQLAEQISSLSKTQLASSRNAVAAKQSEAIASGTASAASAPWFMTLPLIASIVGTITGIFSSLPKFENGGVLGGSSFTGDKLLFRGNSGEMILNGQQQSSLFKMINQGGGSGGNVQFEIKGDRLVGVLNNHNRRQNSYR